MAYDTREGKEPRGPTCIEHQVNEWEWGGKVEENSNLITKISHLDSRGSNKNRGILGAAPSEGRKLHLMLCCVGGAREAPLKGGKPGTLAINLLPVNINQREEGGESDKGQTLGTPPPYLQDLSRGSEKMALRS